MAILAVPIIAMVPAIASDHGNGNENKDCNFDCEIKKVNMNLEGISPTTNKQSSVRFDPITLFMQL